MLAQQIFYCLKIKKKNTWKSNLDSGRNFGRNSDKYITVIHSQRLLTEFYRNEACILMAQCTQTGKSMMIYVQCHTLPHITLQSLRAHWQWRKTDHQCYQWNTSGWLHSLALMRSVPIWGWLSERGKLNFTGMRSIIHRCYQSSPFRDWMKSHMLSWYLTYLIKLQ